MQVEQPPAALQLHLPVLCAMVQGQGSENIGTLSSAV